MKQQSSIKTNFETPAHKKAFECAEIIRIGGYDAGVTFFLENGLTVPSSPLAIVDGKKEAIAQLHIQANGRYTDMDDEIQKLAAKSQIKSMIQEHSIKLEIPLIQ